MYRKLDILSQRASYNIGVNHHPILGFAARQDVKGKVSLLPGNQGIQSIFGAINPLVLPPPVNAMLSGHVHLWQEVSFSSPHPAQFVAGFSGAMEDACCCQPHCRPAPHRHHCGTLNGFSFMTMERNGARQWDIKVWDTSGYQVDSCRIDGSKSVCEIAWVK